MRASSLSFIWLTCLLFRRYDPLLGVSRQPIRFISVDLPEPDGPMMATYSPRSMSIDTPRRAWISSEPITYVFQRSRVSIKAMCRAGLSPASYYGDPPAGVSHRLEAVHQRL